VAKDRRLAIEDAQMRHGRKNRSGRVDGYKRPGRRDLDSGLMAAVGLTPANAPEASVAPQIKADLAVQPITLKEWHIWPTLPCSVINRRANSKGREFSIILKQPSARL
jgi:transposase